MKKHVRIIITSISCLLLWIIGYRLITGYYPIPEILRKLHYVNQLCDDDNSIIKSTIIDESFRLNEKGYTAESVVKEANPLVYCLYLGFKNPLPLDSEFKGHLLLEIIKDGQVIFSNTIKGAERNLGSVDEKSRMVNAVRGFEVYTLPFYIAHKKYRNSTIKVTVIKEDLELKEPDNPAILSIAADTYL